MIHIYIPKCNLPTTRDIPPTFYALMSLEILKLVPVPSAPRRPVFSSCDHRSGYCPRAQAWNSAWSLRPGSALYIMPRLSLDVSEQLQMRMGIERNGARGRKTHVITSGPYPTDLTIPFSSPLMSSSFPLPASAPL